MGDENPSEYVWSSEYVVYQVYSSLSVYDPLCLHNEFAQNLVDMFSSSGTTQVIPDGLDGRSHSLVCGDEGGRSPLEQGSHHLVDGELIRPLLFGHEMTWAGEEGLPISINFSVLYYCMEFSYTSMNNTRTTV